LLRVRDEAAKRLTGTVPVNPDPPAPNHRTVVARFFFRVEAALMLAPASLSGSHAPLAKPVWKLGFQ
jgi:hypothetical protein